MKKEVTDFVSLIVLILTLTTISALTIFGLVKSDFLASIDDVKNSVQILFFLVTIYFAMTSAKRALDSWTLDKEKETLARVDNLFEEYLSQKFVDDRNTVIQFWLKHLDGWKSIVKETHNDGEFNFDKFKKINSKELDSFSEEIKVLINQKDSLDDIKAYKLETKTDYIKLTREVINKYEKLGNLSLLGVFSDKLITTLFKTSIGDTFLVVLPFIWYKRKSKKDYASSFEQLLLINNRIFKNSEDV